MVESLGGLVQPGGALWWKNEASPRQLVPFGGRIREALADARHLVEESGKSVNQIVAFGGRMREVWHVWEGTLWVQVKHCSRYLRLVP